MVSRLYIELMREAAERSPVSIVVATGLHLRPPGFVNRRIPDAITDLFVHDLVEGIAGTGLRAGVITIAVNPGVEGVMSMRCSVM